MKEIVFAAFLITPTIGESVGVYNFEAFGEPVIKSTPMSRVKTCYCSTNCTCGCNQGEECTCPQYYLPPLGPTTYPVYQPVMGPGGITAGMAPMQPIRRPFLWGSPSRRVSCGPSG